MKTKEIIATGLLLLGVLTAFSQVPEQFNYQAVIRNSDGTVRASESIQVQIQILKDAIDGTSVFTETHSPTTSSSGLMSIAVGSISDLGAVDWANGSYFLKVSIGGLVIGTTQLLSVPFAFYAESADRVLTADYNALTNTPTTISGEQSAKVDSITVTAVTDLEQMKIDVAANNSKVEFPGFGTVPGTALEGDNTIWNEQGGDIFFGGRVGINVAPGSDFMGSSLRINGAVLYEGTPSTTTPGLLFYDPSGSAGTGAFKYYDNNGVLQELGSGALTFNGNALTSGSSGDLISSNDFLVDGSLGIGQDIVDGENFGFSTMILKENNLRIVFDDTDDPGGTMPANDWQIITNDSNNGGESYFSIKDLTGGTIPFYISAGTTTNNALKIASDGKIGINEPNPTAELEVNGTIIANSFIGDGSGLTGITGGTGGISNTGSTIIGADTDSDTNGDIALQTQGVTRLIVANDGNVGIGTTNPTQTLEVNGTAKFDDIDVTGSVTISGDILQSVTSDPNDSNPGLDLDVAGKGIINFSPNVGSVTITGFQAGISGQEVTIINSGFNQSIIIKHNGSGTQKILNPGAADVTLVPNNGAKYVYTGSEWYCVSLNN